MTIRYLAGRCRNVGGVHVNRLLPARDLSGVGPFVYFDHFGPVDIAAGGGIAVPPHPHIGLATITYLFSGELLHRDSLGNEQVIRPGEVNWMTAGRGVVHSERSDPDRCTMEGSLHGIQCWVALPVAAENCPPDFVHHGRDSLPSWERDGASVTVVAGQAFGETSPVRTCSALCYVDVKLEAGAKIPLANEFVNLGIYPVSGAVSVSSVILPVGTLGLVDSQGEGVDLEAHDVSRVLLLGGAELEDRRYLWWNFVASSPERIEQAKVDWRDHRFAPVPGDSERMPMPGE